jgi:hypothetical protein
VSPFLEEITWMNRRNWSNLFVVLAATILILGFWPANPARILCWLVAPGFFYVGALARRRMV